MSLFPGSGSLVGAVAAPNFGRLRRQNQQALLEAIAQRAYLQKLAAANLAQEPQGGGGGILGHIPGGEFLHDKLDRAVADIMNIPGALYHQGQEAFNTMFMPSIPGIGQLGISGGIFSPHVGTNAPNIGTLLGELGSSYKAVGQHPLRDPFATAMAALPFAKVGGAIPRVAGAYTRGFRDYGKPAETYQPTTESMDFLRRHFGEGAQGQLFNPLHPADEVLPSEQTSLFGQGAREVQQTGLFNPDEIQGGGNFAQGFTDWRNRVLPKRGTPLPAAPPGGENVIHLTPAQLDMFRLQIPRLLAEGRWKESDWMNLGLQREQALEMRDQFAARLGAPIEPKLSPIGQLVDNLMKNNPGLAQARGPAIGEQYTLPGTLERQLPPPQILGEVPRAKATAEYQGAVERAAIPLEQQKVPDWMLAQYLPKGRSVKQAGRHELARAEAAARAELASGSQASSISGKPTGEPTMAPIPRTGPEELPSKPVQPAFTTEPVPRVKGAAGPLRIFTRNPETGEPQSRRFQLRVSERAHARREELTKEAAALDKQIKQLHGQMQHPQEIGLQDTVAELMAKAKPLAERRREIGKILQKIKPYSIEDVVLGTRVRYGGVKSTTNIAGTRFKAAGEGAPSSYAKVEAALKHLSALNRQRPITPEELAGIPRPSARAAERPAPEAPAATPVRAGGGGAGATPPATPREATPLSDSTAARVPLREQGFTRSNFEEDFETGEVNQVFENPSTKERITFDKNGNVIEATRFDSKQSRIVEMQPERVQEIMDRAETEARKPPATPEQAADRIGAANDDLIATEAEQSGVQVTPKISAQAVEPKAAPSGVRGIRLKSGSGRTVAVQRGGSKLKLPGEGATAKEIGAARQFAKQNPEYSDYLPDLDAALEQVKGPKAKPPAKETTEAGLGARALGLGPRDVRETLGLENDKAGQTQATQISRQVHPQVVKWAKKGGSKGELVAILKPHFGAKAAALAKKIIPLVSAAGAGMIAAGPKGASLGALTAGEISLSPAVRAGLKAAGKEALRSTAPRTMTVRYVTTQQMDEQGRKRGIAHYRPHPGDEYMSKHRTLAGEKITGSGKVEVPLSRSEIVAGLQKHLQIPLLERYPSSRFAAGKALLTGRTSFHNKIAFERQELNRLGEAIANLGIIPKPPKIGETDAEFRARMGNWVDSANMLAKILVLFAKPAYIPANLMGQIFLSAVDHAWNPLSLGRSVAIQRDLFTRDVRKQLRKVEKGKRVLSTSRPEDEIYLRAQKVRSLMGGGLIQAIYHSRQPGFVSGSITRAYEGAARATGRLIDTPFRDNAFINAAVKHGFDSSEKIAGLLDSLRPIRQNESMDHYVSELQRQHPELVAIAREANRNLIDYGRMGPREKSVIRRIVFFYPWVKGATIYGGRMAAEHPFQTSYMTMIGQAQAERTRQELGPLPSYEEGIFKVGSANVPGLGKMPLIVNPASASVLSTPADVAATVAGIFEGGSQHPIGDFAGPLPTLAAAAMYRIDPSTGAEYPSNMSVFDILQKQSEKLVAPLNLSQKLSQADRISSGEVAPGDMPLLPETRKQAWGRYLLGLSPVSLNTQEAQSRALSEQQSTLSRREAAAFKVQRYSDQYLTEFKRVGILPQGASKLPPELRRAFSQRAERDAELKVWQDQLGHRLNPLESLQGELQLLVRKGTMNQADAKALLRAMSGASESEINYQRRQLKNAFFGGQVLSAYASVGKAAGAELPELR